MFLDTSYCIDLFREQNKNVEGPAIKKLSALGSSPVFLSVFVLCELHAGAVLSKNLNSELRKVELFAENIEVVYPDRPFSVLYGETEAYLRKRGTPIPVMDLLIGISARQHGIPVLTRDDRHFKLIPNLVVETY